MPRTEANGIRLEHESFGDPGAPAIVMVMGLGVQMILWPDALCRALADAGFHVLRFDNRDAGLSSHLDVLGMPRIGVESLRYALHLPVRAPYALDDLASDTSALLDALGISRAHLVGASMGAMVAQNLAAREPAKVASLTSIMSTTGSRKLPKPTWRARRALLSPAAKPGDLEGAAARMMRVLRVIGSRSHPAPEAQLRDMCERHARRSHDPAGIARQLVAVAAAGDRTGIVRAIRAPTLVLHGDEDPLIPPAAGEATARAIVEGGGRAEFVSIRGMGHDLPDEVLPEIARRIVAHCRANS